MKTERPLPRLGWLALLALPAMGLRAAVPQPQGLEFFEKSIRPLFEAKCIECHNSKGKKKGGLVMDSRAGLLSGGDSGPALVAGKPEESRIIEAVRYQHDDLKMPPKGQLPKAEIAALERWVAMGAPDPRVEAPAVAKAEGGMGMSAERGRDFWSFKPVQPVALPRVQRSEWVRSPVDAFVLAELEAKGLTPAPMAEKQELIRRATQDLTGLMPSPEEVAAFVADERPDAFSRLVERLLSSPAYGERWGRHWLDVARYADSNGMDENIAFGHAWRYRDYVVRAFNQDKPYDEFVIEQLAGDLLPNRDEASRHESLAALGFLALGGRVLAEPDVQKMQLDIIDEQLDTLGKAFLGMTFGCARCHDHKFDPISQADYYSMAAIFRSTRSLADEKMGAIKFAFEHSLATPEQTKEKAQRDAMLAAQRKTVTEFAAKARAELRRQLDEGAVDYLAAALQLPDDPGFDAVQALAQQRGLRPRYLLQCRLVLVKQRGNPFFVPWHEAFKRRDEKALRAHYAPLFAAALKARAVKDKAPSLPAAVQQAKAALEDLAGILTIPDKDAHALDAPVLAQLEAMQEEAMRRESGQPDLPGFMGVAEGPTVPKMPIHIRGSYLTLGREVERAFPVVMRSTSVPAVFPQKQSGRLQLARWLVSGEHPLTARVLANRLWRWHFGRGLVGSTENFGVLGDRPSHPQLLDWLAMQLVERGWSWKEMHRLLMNSSVYQMASRHPAAQAPSSATDPTELDPENRLLWRFPVQRLEAEQLRDAMLQMAGTLSLEVGGKTIPLRNREFVFNHTSRDHTRYESPRRALYLPIIRNHLYDILEQFDYPDPTMPTGSRNATVVAPQALILLNAPVVMDSAEAMASRLMRERPGADDRARVDRAWQLAYGRSPAEAEWQRAKNILAQGGQRGLALLCQSLMASNEFIYLP